MKGIFSGLLRQCVVALLALVALTVIVGGLYPAAVWGISRLNSSGAEGSIVTDSRGCTTSLLLGVDPQVRPGQPDPYLHTRVAGGVDDPMAPGDPAASGASNLGPNSPDLVKIVDARRAVIAAREGVAPSAVPTDAVTASGSGLDPDISPAYARLQVPRIARVTGLSVARVEQAVANATHGRQLGVLGTERVDVQQVNVALADADARVTGPHCR